ncbi:MAG TPA: glycosyltransferase [Anaerohalosphaeraceae bacterium]|jgi:glycosyltransferase involved in cell wall biosynthesis|nr:glycosyltransferase [Anaerohalosphaeraceae bacterium]HRT49989.1 glycosyltransferase [Anaerohalosphaeraceae bacterium]HRT85713.1 glycosyltransferase [Anaerohalosphaeraceae bacterium]
MKNADSETINVVFMANFNYPHGMAGTKNVQGYIEYLHASPNFEPAVLVLRQNRIRPVDNPLSGEYKGVPYTTIGSDIRGGFSAVFKAPKYFLQGMKFLRNRRIGGKNILYVYGYPSTDNILLIGYARHLGYKVVFYIVEDIAHQSSAPDFFARLKNRSARLLCGMMSLFTDAALVVSSRLMKKIEGVAKGRFPVVLDPITVDVRRYEGIARDEHEGVHVFYGGTFGEKDGVEFLIAGFEKACETHDNLTLILTGQGDAGRMDKILGIVAASPFRDRIVYKGYVSDEEYDRLLCNCDILCMTRTSSPFANAGFPYKLGEYLAAGRPVIATDVSDVRVYLEDKVNALIIAPDSGTAVAEAIEYLLADRERAERIGRAGREAARRYFDVSVTGEQFRKLLVDL